MLLRPIEHGVDIVVYSTTKFIGGHGMHIGGAIVDSGNFNWADNPEKWPEFCAPRPAYHGVVFAEALRPIGNIAYIIHIRTHWLRDTGAAMSPFAAFLFLQGIETLHLRMPRHCENALKVAECLEGTRPVEWVNYPGLHEPHGPRQRPEVPAQRGRARSSASASRAAWRRASKFINSVQARQPPGQHRRRQDPGHPPRLAPRTSSLPRKSRPAPA